MATPTTTLHLTTPLSQINIPGTVESAMSTHVAVLSWTKTEMNCFLVTRPRNQEDLADSLMDLILEEPHHLAKRMMKTSRESSNKLALSSKKVSTQPGMHFGWPGR